MTSNKFEKLQSVIGYKFNDIEILFIALTHKSFAAESGIKCYNERMEFLGDSILSAIIAEALYIKYCNKNEGMLSQLKSRIVSRANLSVWAKQIRLGDYVFLGKCENTKETRERKNLLCDIFEAIIGAIYLDGGFTNAKKFVLGFLNNKKNILVKDYKSRLQEIIQLIHKKLPEYQIVKELGPDHKKQFEVVVYIDNKFAAKGFGNSKKEAHQSAAKKALKNINKDLLLLKYKIILQKNKRG
ncbi:MAG: ribonuclease III [Endomicrobium sp.]|jgi:ribonuclease-3|nr:ribonuclease III [Endomicrobium sp.]